MTACQTCISYLFWMAVFIFPLPKYVQLIKTAKWFEYRPFQNGSFTSWAEGSRFWTITNTLLVPLLVPTHYRFPCYMLHVVQCKPTTCIWSLKSLRIRSSDPMCQIRNFFSLFGTSGHKQNTIMCDRTSASSCKLNRLSWSFQIEILLWMLNFE